MPDENELTITRVFDAPINALWDAWSKPESVKRWWGPKGFSAPQIKIDFNEGGKYLFCMRGPDPDKVVKDYWSTGTYKEIKPMKRIVCTDSFSDEKGNVVPASYYSMPGDIPIELLITIDFEEEDGKTRMTLKHLGHTKEVFDLARQGWEESFDKLEASVRKNNNRTKVIIKPGEKEFVITRVFDASSKEVFKAFTSPKLIPQWWGPKAMKTDVEKMEIRPGGKWRFIQHDKAGKEYAFQGEYKDIVPEKRLVYTFEYEGMPGHVSTETITFEESGGKTKVIDKTVFGSVEDRDQMINQGMEKGALETMDRLAGVLAKT